MRGALSRLAAGLAVLALAGLLGSCAEGHGLEVVEGEPVELGELDYNVQMTRFLNPNDTEDAEYLIGQPPAQPGTSYLGVFMRITSESESDLPSTDRYAITDIRGDRYEPVESDSPFALEIGAPVPAESELPRPESLAASGPVGGGLLIFLVDDVVIDRRPLILEIPTEEGTGEVQLDI